MMPSSSSSSRATPGDPDGVGERRTRLGVEVDAQLVGVVDVGAAYRPGVEGQGAHVRAPDRHRDLGRADLVGGPAGREGDLDALEVVGRALGHPLLVERVGFLSGRPVASLIPGRTPEVQRSSAVGRSRSARISPSSTLAKYSATISLVTSGVRSVAS